MFARTLSQILKLPGQSMASALSEWVINTSHRCRRGHLFADEDTLGAGHTGSLWSREGVFGSGCSRPPSPDTQAAPEQAESQLRVYCQCWWGGVRVAWGLEGFVTGHCGAEVTGVLLLLSPPVAPGLMSPHPASSPVPQKGVYSQEGGFGGSQGLACTSKPTQEAGGSLLSRERPRASPAPPQAGAGVRLGRSQSGQLASQRRPWGGLRTGTHVPADLYPAAALASSELGVLGSCHPCILGI